MATTIVPKPELEANSFDSTLASARSTMMFSEVISLAVDSFRASKARFLLTMLGMVIGSASIILVVTVGMTGKQYALDTISSLGPNKIEMQYSGGSIIGPDNTTTPDYMTREDMQAVVDTVPGIVAYSPMLEDHDRISIGGGVTKDAMLLGVSPQYKEVRGLVVLAGRFFDDQDAGAHAKVAVLNKPLAIKLFGSEQAAVGQEHLDPRHSAHHHRRLQGEHRHLRHLRDQRPYHPHPLRGGALLHRHRQPEGDLLQDGRLHDGRARCDSRSPTLIKSRHRPNSVYHALTLTDVLHDMAKVATILTWVLLLAASITLIVSGVGIMNSMLANVQARIREIGIRKALGATRREIRLQFLTEAVFLSLAGGILGTLVGLGIPILLGLLTPYKIPVGWLAAPIALATSVIVGVIFGTVPANRAARLDPVETLKYE